MASILAVSNCDLRLAQLRVEHADPGLRLGQIGLGRKILLRECLYTRHDPGRILQIGGDGGDRGIGRLGARAGQLKILFGEHAIEPRDDLTLGHRHAFVDEDLDHLAGDLGRNGCLAARHHIAGGRQTAGRLVIRCRLLRGLLRPSAAARRAACGLFRRVLPAELVSGEGGECDDAGDNRRRNRQPAATRSLRLAGAAIDRKRSQQFALVFGHRSFPSGCSLQFPRGRHRSRAGGLAHGRSTRLAIAGAGPQLSVRRRPQLGCKSRSALASARRRPFFDEANSGNLKLNGGGSNCWNQQELHVTRCRHFWYVVVHPIAIATLPKCAPLSIWANACFT